MRCGGGINHRLGLDDAAMLGENHIAWAEGITAAIAAVRQQAPWPSAVIVEAETEAQALEAVQAGANGVLLDEFSPEQLTQLVPRLQDYNDRGVVLEASAFSPNSCGLRRHRHRSDLHQRAGHPQPLVGPEHAFQGGKA